MVISPFNNTVAAPVTRSSGDSYSLVIEPGENNVAEGDKSNNTATITLTTPKREASVEVSREQAFDFIALRAQRKALLSYLSPQPSGSPLVKLAVLNNADIEQGDVAPLAEELFKRKRLQTYADVVTGNTSNNQPGYSAPSTGVDIYNNAVDAYIKQTLFFSRADQAQGFSTSA